MRSLKNEASIKQISVDHLLNITKQPDNTCPLIDALIYSGNRRTKVYDVSIDFDPAYLWVDESDLIKTISKLESWSEDVVSKYYEIEEKITDPEEKEELESYIKLITEKISGNRTVEVQMLAESLNKIVEHWSEIYDSYNDYTNQISDVNQEMSSVENKISDEDPEDEDNELDLLYGELDSAKENLIQLERDLDKIKGDFDYFIDRDFDNVSSNFSQLLEVVRSNNEELRSTTRYLKEGILNYLKDDYMINQPLEYLKEKESGNDNEISIGVIDRSYYAYSFLRFSKYLKVNGVISNIQESIFDKSKTIKDVIDLIKDIGYQKIYYYETANDFLKDPESYKVIGLTPIIKNTAKLKI